MPTDIVKQGYVQVKSKHLGTWNKRWLKLRNEISGKAKRLEKYSDEAAARTQGSERTTYELNSIHYVGRLSDSKKKHGIRMIMEDSSTVQFAADSEMEADNWLTDIQELKSGALGSSKKSMFEVYLLKSSALDASGECLLEVRADCICLLDIDNPKRVQLTWPFSSIRKYCTERGLFRIETGRSSPTGEGLFMFDSRCAGDIHDCVQAAITSMANAKKQQPPSPAPAPAPAYEAERAYHSSMKSPMTKQNHYDSPPRYPAQSVKVNASSQDCMVPPVKVNQQPTRSAARPPNGSGRDAYELEHDPHNSPPPPIDYLGPGGRGQSRNTGVSEESWQQDDADEAYYTAGQQPINNPPPYAAPAPPAKGRGGSQDYIVPEVKVNKQSTRSAARPPNGSGSNAYGLAHDPHNSPPSPIDYLGPGRRGQSRNTGVSGESWQQDDADEAYYTAGQQPITFQGSTKNSLKNQAQVVNYKEANPHYGSGNAVSWRRDENDNDGEYYTAGPSLPPRRQGSTSSSSHVTNHSMTENVRTAVKCDRSTSMQVKTSVKDEDDKSLECALKGVFDGTDLHMSRTVDRFEIDNLDLQ